MTEDREGLTAAEAATLLDRLFAARAKYNATVAAALKERSAFEAAIHDLSKWHFLGTDDLSNEDPFGDDSTKSMTVTLFEANSGQLQYGETLTLNREEAIQYIRDPVAFAARRIGALPAEYLEWLELGGLAYCGGLTADNLPCRTTIGRATNFAEWKALHEQGYCKRHKRSPDIFALSVSGKPHRLTEARAVRPCAVEIISGLKDRVVTRHDYRKYRPEIEAQRVVVFCQRCHIGVGTAVIGTPFLSANRREWIWPLTDPRRFAKPIPAHSRGSDTLWPWHYAIEYADSGR